MTGSMLAAAMMWGNPFTDVPELMSRSVVVMDDYESSASEHALRLADTGQAVTEFFAPENDALARTGLSWEEIRNPRRDQSRSS